MTRPIRWGGLTAVVAFLLAAGSAARGDDPPGPRADHRGDGAPALGASGLAFDAAGRLYVADPRRDRVAIVGFAGETLGELGAGVLRRPSGVAVAPGGTVLVSDRTGVRRFAADGTPAGGFATGDPAGIAVGRDGTVYVSEPGRVARFAADGTPLGSFPADRPRGLAVTGDGTLWVAVGDGVAHTTADGAPIATAPADHAEGVAAAPDGTVLVAERERGRVARLAADGSRVGAIGGDYDDPRAVAVDCRGNVAVADAGPRRIHRINLSPSALPACAAPAGPAAGPEPARAVARRPPVLPTVPALLPVRGRRALAVPLGGTVFVRRPGADDAERLRAGGLVPMGTRVDTREGRVRLTFATRTADFDTVGTTQSADVDAGIVAVAQRARDGAVELRLAGPMPACHMPALAQPVGARHVWVSARGSFRTRGRLATGTARNARWLTEDRCDGTLVRVARGAVRVRDHARATTVHVRAGGRYLVRPRR